LGKAVGERQVLDGDAPAVGKEDAVMTGPIYGDVLGATIDSDCAVQQGEVRLKSDCMVREVGGKSDSRSEMSVGKKYRRAQGSVSGIVGCRRDDVRRMRH
jgi:hypothetical protein